MIETQIKQIFINSKKPFNSLKPLKNELEEFSKIMYPAESLNILESAYLYINRNENIYCNICNKKKEFLNIYKGYNDFCSIECEKKRIDNLFLKEELFKFLFSIKEYSNQKQISLLKEQKYLSSLFFYTKFLEDESSFSERIYCILNNIKEPLLCEECKKNKVNFKNNSYGYFKYCSNHCSFLATSNNRKQTNINKYGVENTFNIEKSINNRNIIMKDPNFIKKCIFSKENKYGKNKELIYNKVKENWNNKSVEEIDIINQQRKETKISLYGDNYINEINQKASITRKRNSINRKIKIFKKLNIIPLFDINDYYGVENIKYKWKCLKCNLEYDKSIDNGLFPICPKCNAMKGISNGELEIIQFLKELNIEYIQSDRKTINPLEIDILSKNIGIEYNGLYYHSYEYLNEKKSNSEFIINKLKELKLNSNIGKSYHLLKSKLCEMNNINLIHISEDEWINPIKQEIWKSILRNKFNKNYYKFYARDCYIKEISVEEKNLFLEENHLQGEDSSSIRYGLFLKKNINNFDKDTLISVMTFGLARYKNKNDFELYRFCNKLNISVIGSASKLFKHFIKEFRPKTVLSYGDKRFGGDNFYEKIGFIKVSETIPGFRYIRNNITYNRQLFQKHLLKDYFIEEKHYIKEYSEEYTGEEIMRLNGYKKIYDCGNNKYIFICN